MEDIYQKNRQETSSHTGKILKDFPLTSQKEMMPIISTLIQHYKWGPGHWNKVRKRNKMHKD